LLPSSTPNKTAENLRATICIKFKASLAKQVQEISSSAWSVGGPPVSLPEASKMRTWRDHGGFKYINLYFVKIDSKTSTNVIMYQ